VNVDKGRLIAAFRALMAERREALLSTSADAQAGARVDGDHRPANRGERGAVSQQAALAHGLKVRAAELERTLELLDEVPREPRGGDSRGQPPAGSIFALGGGLLNTASSIPSS
jgi:hypothetical protein